MLKKLMWKREKEKSIKINLDRQHLLLLTVQQFINFFLFAIHPNDNASKRERRPFNKHKTKQIFNLVVLQNLNRFFIQLTTKINFSQKKMLLYGWRFEINYLNGSSRFFIVIIFEFKQAHEQCSINWVEIFFLCSFSRACSCRVFFCATSHRRRRV
jgi:hypothetical protein